MLKSLGGFQLIVNSLSPKKMLKLCLTQSFEPQVEGSLADSRLSIFLVNTHFP